MSVLLGKTIQIYLPDGEPRGIRIAEITTRLVKAIQVPQLQISQLQNITESGYPSCYFLFGESPETGRPTVYIGQSENFISRVFDHDRDKDFNSVVMIVSSSNSFTQTHIKYLESHSIEMAREAGRYQLLNIKNETKPHVPEPIEADILDSFSTVETLLTTLGFPLFEHLMSQRRQDESPSRGDDGTSEAHHVFKCTGPGGIARGELSDEGFVIYEGSIIRKDVVPSMQSYTAYMQKREAFIQDGTLVPDDSGHYRLTRNLLLSTPSAASCLVLGNSSNGWWSWFSESTGKSLHDVYREPLADSQEETE